MLNRLRKWWNKPGDALCAALDTAFECGRKLGAKEEREDCAKLCENNDMSWADDEWNVAVRDCAAKIMARVETEKKHDI